MAIEVDGGQHGEENEIEKNKERTKFLKGKGIEVLRFWNVEIFKNMEGVLITIRKKLGLEI